MNKNETCTRANVVAMMRGREIIREQGRGSRWAPPCLESRGHGIPKVPTRISQRSQSVNNFIKTHFCMIQKQFPDASAQKRRETASIIIN